MKTRIIIILVAIAVGFQFRPDFFEAPASLAAAPDSLVKKVKQYEYLDLFEQRKPLSRLAEKDRYTVVEVYLDSCTVCKQIEAQFPPFLARRNDVVIRRVHIPESGFNFNFSSDEEIREFYETMALYNFNHVVMNDDKVSISNCGTPHIEIFGPDRQLLASDACAEKSNKAGLAYLRQWFKAEGL